MKNRIKEKDLESKRYPYIVEPNYHYREKCRYIVIDLETGHALIAGEKMKCTWFLEKVNTFRVFPNLRRKMTCYKRELTIKGRPCVIIYYAGKKTIDPSCTVLVSGCLVGLRGQFYDFSGQVWHCDALLKNKGYTRE